MVRHAILISLVSVNCLTAVAGSRMVFVSDAKVRIIRKGLPGWKLRGGGEAALFAGTLLCAESVWLPDHGAVARIGGGVRLIAPDFTIAAERARFNRKRRLLRVRSGYIFNGTPVSGLLLTNITFDGRHLTFMGPGSSVRISRTGVRGGG